MPVSSPRAAWLLVLLLAGCDPASGLAPLPPYAEGVYRLGPDDQVRVITYDADQLSDDFRVNDAGEIAMPLLGAVRAAGLTTQGLGDAITALLKKKQLLNDPSVSVEVIGYRPVFVLGEVNKPGQYPYRPGMTVLSAVAVAGGFTYRGVQDVAEIIRTINARPIDGRVAPSDRVAPGDVIKVFERHY